MGNINDENDSNNHQTKYSSDISKKIAKEPNKFPSDTKINNKNKKYILDFDNKSKDSNIPSKIAINYIIKLQALVRSHIAKKKL